MGYSHLIPNPQKNGQIKNSLEPIMQYAGFYRYGYRSPCWRFYDGAKRDAFSWWQLF